MSYIRFCSTGTKFYYNDEGHLHREDGPARICCNGHTSWWINGNKHRLDGPAVIHELNSGVKHWLWFIDGRRLNRQKEKLLNIWYENKQNGI